MKMDPDILLSQIRNKVDSITRTVYLPVANREIVVGVMTTAEAAKLKQLSVSLKVGTAVNDDLPKQMNKIAFNQECDTILAKKIKTEGFEWSNKNINDLDRLCLIIACKSVDEHAKVDFVCGKCRNMNHKFIIKSTMNTIAKTIAEKILHDPKLNVFTIHISDGISFEFHLRHPSSEAQTSYNKARLDRFISISNKAEQDAYLFYTALVDMNYLWLDRLIFNNIEFDLSGRNIVDILSEIPSIDSLMGAITSLQNGVDVVMQVESECQYCEHKQSINLLKSNIII